jgi:hypothetical protein
VIHGFFYQYRSVCIGNVHFLEKGGAIFIIYVVFIII